MGLYLCTERFSHVRYFEPPSDSPRMKSKSCVLADIPPATIKEEQRDEKRLVSSLDQNSERKPSIDSIGDEKQITLDLSVASEDFTIVSPAKNKKDVKFRSCGCDWVLEASEGMDFRQLAKSPIKPLPDLGDLRLRKKRSSEDDIREMENMLTQVIHESKLDRSPLFESHVLRDSENSESYTSSHN